MMARTRARASNDYYWPGFVDALTTLLLVIIFLLVVFVLAQVVLSQAISGKDAALERLNQQVQELADLLDLERSANAELRLNVTQLSNSLQNTVQARDELAQLLEQMTTRAALLEERAATAEQALGDAEARIDANRETVEVRLRQLESLRRDIVTLRRVRSELEAQVAALSIALETSKTRADELSRNVEQSRLLIVRVQDESAELAEDLKASRTEIAALKDRGSEIEEALDSSRRMVVILRARGDTLEEELSQNRQQSGALRDRSKELEARLESESERTLLAQKDVAEKDIRLAELLARQAATDETLDQERELSEKRRNQVAILNLQIVRLREELQRLAALLDAAEEKDKDSQAIIKNLGQRLNRALAAKVEELSRYRSEFFGRLKEILGKRRDIEIVGDRFVFQSEVLFESASDELGSGGQEQMRRLAQALIEIAAKIPPEIDWILRVDGHTDVQPISTARFPSNWELSTARAISVVRFLIEIGVPAKRLAATGFAAFQPIDPRRDEIGFRRNRRIELKLTQR